MRQTPSNLLITGPSAIGTSTLLARIAQRLEPLHVRGFLSASMWDGGERVGWRIDACAGNEGGVFAYLGRPSNHRIGRYGADMALFERIALPQLVPVDPRAIYLIDEIGFAPEWSAPVREVLTALLASPARVVAVVRHRDDGRTPFAQEVKRRSDIELIEVTPENRDALADEIADRFLPPASHSSEDRVQ